ncbi:MAG: hypothetical protein RBT63_01000 [Bdellovibrionales bacterium]|jgi:hypothetical protein|nr:hypothetical protein [Bdellovibrionales bacterium]
MNHFSAEKTLSNFMTAVRMTVDFVSGSIKWPTTQQVLLFTTTLFAISFLQSAAHSQPSQNNTAQTAQNLCTNTENRLPGESEAACTVRLNQQLSGTDTNQCDKVETRFTKLHDDAQAACGTINQSNLTKCWTTFLTCQKADEEVASLIEADEMSDDEYCNTALANRCSGLERFQPTRDYREEERNAEGDRKDAKKTLDELLKDQADSKKKASAKMREVQDEQEELEAAVSKRSKEITKSIEDGMKKIKSSQQQTFEDAQKAYDEMDAVYIKMRQDARTAEAAVAQAEDSLQTTCRGAAERKYQETEKIRLQNAKKKKNVGSSTRLAGQARRSSALTARTQQLNYMAFMNECLNGASAEGKNAINQIATKKRELANLEGTLRDQIAMIEKQRASVMQRLQALESSVAEDYQAVIQKAQDDLTNLYNDKTRVQQKNARLLQEYQQGQMLDEQNLQQQLQAANEELMAAGRRATLAGNRQICLGRNASLASSSSRDRRSDRSSKGDYSAIDSLLTALVRTCTKEMNTCLQDQPVCSSLKRPEEKSIKTPDVESVTPSRGNNRTIR